MTTDTITLNSVTETRRRLRAAKRAIEAIDRNWPSYGRHEVQTRIIPGYAATLDEARAVAARSGEDGDDLDSFVDWERAPRHPQFRRPGAIVHIVSSDAFGLFDVRMVWLGFGPDDVPVVVDRRGGDVPPPPVMTTEELLAHADRAVADATPAEHVAASYEAMRRTGGLTSEDRADMFKAAMVATSRFIGRPLTAAEASEASAIVDGGTA